MRAVIGRLARTALLCVAAHMMVGAAPVASPAKVLPAPPVSQPDAAHTVDVPQPSHDLNARDLEAWFDGMLPVALEQGDVAGAVVSVVKDGQILFAKGYGYADVARKVPMDARRTLVRPGSVSKLVTWTAVMQLVEQGRLDLNANVNRYLDFKIPEPLGKPITLNQLMAHRAGFEEGLKDAIITDPKSLQSLEVFLKRHVRPVLFAPGETPAYSNYGTALAGYIVQRVSGQSFDDYVAQHIFQPLDMTSSTFHQPLPPRFAARMSKGYMAGSDAPRPFELISFSPAGSLTSSATDMANFMIAHLQDGRFGGQSILRPETARMMYSASIPHANGADVMAHGFFRGYRNGHLILEHGGDTILFHSNLQILPDDGVGLFVSFNSRGKGDAAYGIRTSLIDGFMDRYFPGPNTVTPPALSTAKAHGAEIAGRYETSRRVQSGFMSLFYVLQGQQVVSPQPDGTIKLATAPEKSYREVAPYVWQEVGGTQTLTLRRIDGTKTIIDSHDPIQYFQQVPLRRDASFNLAIFGLSFLLLIAGAVAWVASAISKRVHGQSNALPRQVALARRFGRIAVIADLVYLVGWFALLSPILSNDVAYYTSARDPIIRAMQIAGVIPMLALVAGIWNCVEAFRARRHWLIRLGTLVMAAALAGVLWIAYVGGLLSFTLNY